MRRFWMFCVAAVLFPYVITLAVRGTIYGSGGGSGPGRGSFGSGGTWDSGRRVYLDRQGNSFVDAEEYLVGVVARQMPADYEEEALKAQAVIARTYVYRLMEDRDQIYESELDMEYLEEEQMEKLWGKPRFLEYYEKVRKAVEETCGQVMVYEGEYIEPMFHRTSAGKTRDGDQAHPYLVSVDGKEDLEADGFLTVTGWTPEQLAQLVQGIPGGEQVRAEQIPDTIQVIERDSAGYVTQIQIGSHSFDGEQVRMALGLSSAAYVLEGYEGGVRAVCRGQGHGYGMSQYGAHRKAAEGMGMEEILSYYYQNIEIICPGT